MRGALPVYGREVAGWGHTGNGGLRAPSFLQAAATEATLPALLAAASSWADVFDAVTNISTIMATATKPQKASVILACNG